MLKGLLVSIQRLSISLVVVVVVVVVVIVVPGRFVAVEFIKRNAIATVVLIVLDDRMELIHAGNKSLV